MLHGAPFLCVVVVALYWGRESLLPVPSRTLLRVLVWSSTDMASSPWWETSSPLPGTPMTRGISPPPLPLNTEVFINEGLVSVNGVPICDGQCGMELREKFEDYRQRWEILGRSPAPPRPWVLFASAQTPLPAMARVVQDARSAGVTVEFGVVRIRQHRRPVFGTMEFTEAGIVPGAASKIANSNDLRSWGDWLRD